MSHPAPKDHPELKQAQWALQRMLNHHMTKCDKHKEHLLVVEFTTALCLVCEMFFCTKCNGAEELERGIDALQSAQIEVIDGYFCDFLKQGDKFNRQHEKCAGKHHAHVH